jgi:hypothetical protein
MPKRLRHNATPPADAWTNSAPRYSNPSTTHKTPNFPPATLPPN